MLKKKKKGRENSNHSSFIEIVLVMSEIQQWAVPAQELNQGSLGENQDSQLLDPPGARG